jgi:hypothetical protein
MDFTLLAAIFGIVVGFATIIGVWYQIKEYRKKDFLISSKQTNRENNKPLGTSFRKYFSSVLERPFFYLPDQAEIVENVKARLKGYDKYPIVVVCGPGGIGKTTIAAQIVKASADLGFLKPLGDSAKVMIYQNGEIKKIDEPALLDWDHFINTLIKQLGAPSLIRSQIKKKIDWIRRQLILESYLLLIDNLETLENARNLIFELRKVVVGTKSRVLITYRYTDVGELENVSTVNVISLSPSDSFRFLENELKVRGYQTVDEWLYERGETKEILKQVLGLTRGLPLAIQLVVGLRSSLPLSTIYYSLGNVASDSRIDDLYHFLYATEIQQISEDSKITLYKLFSQQDGWFASDLTNYLGKFPEQELRELTRYSLLYALNRERDNGKREDFFYIHPMLQRFLCKGNVGNV